jgi:streptomycin 6-kinase
MEDAATDDEADTCSCRAANRVSSPPIATRPVLGFLLQTAFFSSDYNEEGKRNQCRLNIQAAWAAVYLLPTI